MPDVTPTSEPETPRGSLWRPVPLAEFELPVRDTKEGLARFWRLLRRTESEEVAELIDPTEVPAERIAHLVPELDLDAAATSLAEALAGWRDRGHEAPRSVVLVGPPGAAAQEVLEAYARREGLAVVTAPGRAELAAGTARCLLPDDATAPLVLPPLERLFLRRSGGLQLLRDLLGALQRQRRVFVAACDSWSWSFLRHTLYGQLGFDRVLAPAAFDGATLRAWLKGLDPTVVFVDAGTGTTVLDDEGEVHEFVRSLAARARGIPGVATALWRRALLDARLGASSEGVRRCRLPRMRDLRAPEVSPSAGKPAQRLLHALLIHERLEEEWLQSVLPDADANVRPLLWDLEGQGLVTEEAGTWRVSAIGYPAVREALAGANTPVDDF